MNIINFPISSIFLKLKCVCVFWKETKIYSSINFNLFLHKKSEKTFCKSYVK